MNEGLSNPHTGLACGPVVMGRYAAEVEDPSVVARAKGTNFRAHFKHMREVTHNVRGMGVEKAIVFLEDVLQYKRAIQFTKYTGGIGRHAQGRLVRAPGDKVRWPQKATKMVLDLLKHAKSNAENKGLEGDLYITSIQCNRAPQQRRRTHRAHGRINPYMRSPAHIEVILSEKPAEVSKAEPQHKPTRKQLAKRRFTKVQVGGAPM